MSLDCAQLRDLAPEVALDVLGGAVRAEAFVHLDECVGCRCYVSELVETVDALPLLVAEAEPPIGFEQRTLAAMAAQRRTPILSRRRLLFAAMALVAATMIVTLAVNRITDSLSRPTAAQAPDSTAPVGLLVGIGNEAVGRLYVSRDHHTFVFVAVDHGVDDGRYRVDVVDGSTLRTVGTLSVLRGAGTWAGPLSSPPRPGATLRLTDAQGTAAATGYLPSS